MADEYRQLIVSADQIDSAVNWVEANKANIIKKIETLDTEVLQLTEDVLLIKGLDLQHMQADINELKTSLETVDAEVLQLTEDVLLIKGLDLQHMKSDIEDLQANTYTKDETDTKITEKVSALVAGAPERFDTLKELADWIDGHADSAASMNSAIQKNAEDIATANTNISKKAEDITTANTNIQKNVDDITAVKNSIAINKSTLGIQCKNKFNYPDTVEPATYRGLDFSWENNILYITGTATESADSYIPSHPFVTTGSQFDFKEDSIMSIVAEGTHDRLSIHLHDGTENKYYSLSNTTEVKIAAGSVLRGIYIKPEKDVEFNASYKIMIRNADVTDNTYEPFKNNDFNARMSALETLSDVVYKYHSSEFTKPNTGYVLRVGNQVHINLTATFITACNAWVGSIVRLPFKAKTPDGSTRYTIKQIQADGRETSIYLQNGSNSFYSSTAFKKGDVITIPPMILDMYVEETTTTEGGE